jgi:uncharacterized protein involved in tolerance to divalent cations
VCIGGAACTAAPFVVAMSAQDIGTGIAFWSGVVIAVLAAGTGMWTVARNVYRWGRKIEDTFETVAELKVTGERMELRQVGTSEQLRDLSERFDRHVPRQ